MIWRRYSRPVQTPILIQAGAFECGAAALGIILAYHGHPVPLAELRRACRVSREGCTAADLVRAARLYGLAARGFRVSDPSALVALPPPFIAHWNLNHFVVVEQIDAGTVTVNNPESGRRRTALDDFARHFTGVVLTFAPVPTFRPRPKRRFPPIRAWMHGIRAMPALPALAILSILNALAGLSLPLLIRPLLDAPASALTMQLAWITLVLVAFLAAWGQSRRMDQAGARLAADRPAAFLRRLLHLPLSFFELRYAGELARRVLLNDTLPAVGPDALSAALGRLTTVVGGVALLWWIDPHMAAAGGGLALLEAVVAQWHHDRLTPDHSELARAENHLLGGLITDLQNVETLKAGGGEDDSLARVQTLHRRVLRLGNRLAAQSLDWIITSLPALTTTLLLLFGLMRLGEGVLGVGGVMAGYLLARQVNGALRHLLALPGMLRRAEADAQRLADVRAETRSPGRRDNPPSPVRGYVLQGVSFAYAAHLPPVLDRLDLALEPGSWTALVSAGGSGKSTLAKILAGLIQPDAGEVLASGRVAWVSRPAPFFAGSVRDNVTLWDERIDEQAIGEAVRDACLETVIAALPQGVDTRLDPRRLPLSGGERQRLALARALLRDPDLLILDEATEALDPATEARIFANLRRQGCTVLLISGRPSTRHACDRILTLRQGRIVLDDLTAQSNPACEIGPDGAAGLPRHVADLGRLQTRLQVAETTPADPEPITAVSLRGILRRHWRSVLRLAGVGILGALAAPAPILSIGAILDHAHHWSLWGGVLAVTLLAAVAKGMGERALATLGETLWASTLAGGYRRLLSLPVVHLHQQEPEELAARAFAGDGIPGIAASVLALLLLAAPLLAIHAAILALLQWASAVAVVVIGLLWLLVRLWLGARFQRQDEVVIQADRRLQRTTEQLIEGVATLQQMGAVGRGVTDWRRQRQAYRAGVAAVSGPRALIAGWDALLPIALFGAGLPPLLAGSFSPGAWITAALVVAALEPLWQQTAAWLLTLLAARRIYRRADELWQCICANPPNLRHPRSISVTGCASTEPVAAALVVEDLTFRYHADGPPILDNISFTAAPGEFVAIVGPSGAGKTTLLRLLRGLEQPSCGEIRWQGGQMERGQIGFVDQHPPLRANSFLQAIAGGRALSVEAVWRAAETVGLAELIRRLPMGLKTPIGEGNLTLTAGQRQQLALARAIAGQPSALLLDEIAGGLDAASQQQIERTLAALAVTRIVVSHALESVCNADKILQLEGGRVVDWSWKKRPCPEAKPQVKA